VEGAFPPLSFELKGSFPFFPLSLGPRPRGPLFTRSDSPFSFLLFPLGHLCPPPSSPFFLYGGPRFLRRPSVPFGGLPSKPFFFFSFFLFHPEDDRCGFFFFFFSLLTPSTRRSYGVPLSWDFAATGRPVLPFSRHKKIFPPLFFSSFSVGGTGAGLFLLEISSFFSSQASSSRFFFLLCFIWTARWKTILYIFILLPFFSPFFFLFFSPTWIFSRERPPPFFFPFYEGEEVRSSPFLLYIEKGTRGSPQETLFFPFE